MRENGNDLICSATNLKALKHRSALHWVHSGFEKSLKVFEFSFKNSRPLKVLENR